MATEGHIQAPKETYTGGKPESGGSAHQPVSLEEIQELCRGGIGIEPSLNLLKGFKLDFSGNRNFHKVFFSVRCDCGTAALLSLEVDKAKSLSQVKGVLPGLLQHLKSKAQQFNNMSCEMHGKLRGGNASKATASPG